MKLSSRSYSKSLWTSIVAMLLIISALVPLIAEAEINSTGTYFWVDPQGNIVESVSTLFSVDIMIENAPTTWAWEATLKFDNDTLGVMSVSEGPWLKDTTKPTLFFTTPWAEANKTGTISIGCTLSGDVAGTSGSGVLCTITFHVEASGFSKLDLQDTALLDMDLLRTDYPNNDGFVTSVSVHDVCITEIKVNATTPIEQGVWVEINVTVKNEGNYTQTFDVKVYADLVTHDPADADTVDVGDETVIGTQTGINLAAGTGVTLTFAWDTTTVAGEKWTISAEVKKPEDDDPDDNIFIGPVVHVVCPHDIKVVSVTPAEIVVPQTKLTNITIVVTNEGLNTEDLTVTVYADTAPPFLSTSIGSYNVDNLAKDATDTTTFTWDTTGALGIYVIGAKAAITGVTEKDLADNELVDGGIAVIIMDGAIIDQNLVNATVYRGQVAMVNVTLKNEGTTMYRTPMAILCYNPTDPKGSLVGVITGITLGIGVTLTFASFSPYGGFPTLPFPNGTYYVCVYLMPVEGWELDTADNGPFIAGTLTVQWKCGDANLDTESDVMDKLRIDLALSPGTPYYEVWSPADVNVDGEVDVMDKLRMDLILSPGTPYYPGC